MDFLFENESLSSNSSVPSSPQEQRPLANLYSPFIDFPLSVPSILKEKFKTTFPVKDDLSSDVLAILGTISKPPPPHSIQNSNFDYCSACLGTGKLLCCDSCPRVFHMVCLAEGYESDEDIDGSWVCKQCKPKPAPPKKTKSISSIFTQLIHAMDSKNPLIFELPLHVRRYFKNVGTHPMTGDYLDLTRTQMYASTSTTKKHDYIGEAAYIKKFNDAAFHGQKCYKCRMGPKILMNTLPNAHPAHASSDMVKCFDCHLWWHLDCTTPPAPHVPVEIKSCGYTFTSATSTVSDSIILNSGLPPLNTEVFHVERIREMRKEIGGVFEYDCFGQPLHAIQMQKKWVCELHAQDIGRIPRDCVVVDDAVGVNNGNVDIVFDDDGSTTLSVSSFCGSETDDDWPVKKGPCCLAVPGTPTNVIISLPINTQSTKNTAKRKPKKKSAKPNKKNILNAEVFSKFQSLKKLCMVVTANKFIHSHREYCVPNLKFKVKFNGALEVSGIDEPPILVSNPVEQDAPTDPTVIIPLSEYNRLLEIMHNE